MGGCCVPGCKSSAAKGHILKCFPQNPEIRAVWIAKVGRDAEWQPTKPLICALHFEAEAWKDLSKLKPGSVPTLFCVCQDDADGAARSVSDHVYSHRLPTFQLPKIPEHTYASKKRRSKFSHFDYCPLSKDCPRRKSVENQENEGQTPLFQQRLGNRVPLRVINVTPASTLGEDFPVISTPVQTPHSSTSTQSPRMPTFLTAMPTSERTLSSSSLHDSNFSDISASLNHPVSDSSDKSHAHPGAPQTSTVQGTRFSSSVHESDLSAISSSLNHRFSDSSDICDSNPDASFESFQRDSESNWMSLSVAEKDSLIRHLLKECSKLRRVAKSNVILRKTNDNLRKKVKRLTETHRAVVDGFRKFISPDKMAAMGRKSTKGVKWSADSIRRGLKEWFSCGSTGYKNHTLPQPSIRVLQRTLQHIKFNPGIQEEVFDALRVKTQHLPRGKKVCVLGIDEMEMTESCDWDPSTKGRLGQCTLPGQEGLASKLCAFVLGGAQDRWKALVDYEFTAKTSASAAIKDRIVVLIKRAHEMGLFVICIITDMGNRSVWKELGFSSQKNSMVYWIPHPCCPGERLYVMPDPLHVFKNMVHMLMLHGEFHLPQVIVDEHGLPSSVVDKSHFEEVTKYQAEDAVKIAPKMTEAVLDESSYHFSKMNVAVARNIINWPTASALLVVGEALNKPEMTTSSWFVELMDKWFNIATARSAKHGLDKKEEQNYRTQIYILHLVIRVFRGIKVSIRKKGTSNETQMEEENGLDGNFVHGETTGKPNGKSKEKRKGGSEWKPFQTGIIMASLVMLEIAQVLFEKFGFDVVLLGFFTQDFVENLFSLVRLLRPTPTPVQVKQCLKKIAVMQCLEPPKNTQYFPGDRMNLVADELLQPERRNEKKCAVSDLPVVEPLPEEVYLAARLDAPPFLKELRETELEVLYRMAGYVAHSMERYENYCSLCIKLLLHNGDPPHPLSSLTTTMDFVNDGQRKVGASIWDACLNAECIIRDNVLLMRPGTNEAEFITSKVKHLFEAFKAPSCHPKLYTRFCRRWVAMRVKQIFKRITEYYRAHRTNSKKKSSKFSPSAVASKTMCGKMLTEGLRLVNSQ